MAATGPVLTPEGLQIQLSAIEVLMAMWQSDGELKMNDEGQRALEALVTYLALPVNSLGGDDSLQVKASLPAQLRMGLRIDPFAGSAEPSSGQGNMLVLDVGLALRKTGAGQAEKDALRPSLTLQPPTWLTSSQYTTLVQVCRLNQPTPSAEEEDIVTYIMDLIEAISEQCALLPLDSTPEAPSSSSPATKAKKANTTKFVYRSWSHLPALNTKEKRGELVEYATLHDPPLTGFVIAGKPALVVLEYPLSDESEFDPQRQKHEIAEANKALLGYWSEIKRVSWSDIPSGHKKVSETLAEHATRSFTDMQDVTGTEVVGGQEALRGTYKHRNDWRLVEAWLGTKGAGGRLREALGADWA